MKSNHKRILALLMVFALVLQFSFSASFLSVYAEGEGTQTEIAQSEAKAAAESASVPAEAKSEPAPPAEENPEPAPPAEENPEPAPPAEENPEPAVGAALNEETPAALEETEGSIGDERASDEIGDSGTSKAVIEKQSVAPEAETTAKEAESQTLEEPIVLRAVAGDSIVLEYGKSETLEPGGTSDGFLSDTWSMSGDTGYVSFNNRSLLVTNRNTSDDTKKVTITHRYYTWRGLSVVTHTETFSVTLNPQKFTVIFKLQDVGETDFSVVKTETVIKYHAASPPSTPEKEGCKFYGWYSDESCSTAADGLDSVIDNMTVYGKYTTPRTLTYHDNSPMGDKGEVPAAAEYGVGNTVSVGTGTMPGYSLVEWNTSADGSGTSYAPGDSFVMPDEDVDLYAQWNNGTFVNIRYMDRGRQFGDPEEAQIDSEGTIRTEMPTRPGFIFCGWSSSPGGDPEYYPGQTFDVGQSDITFHATWGLFSSAVVNGNEQTIGYDGLEHKLSDYFDGNKVQETVNEDGYYEINDLQIIITILAYYVDCTAIEAIGTDAGVYSTPISANVYYWGVISHLVFGYIDTGFEAIVNAGLLTINPAELTIKTQSAEKRYDGEPLTAGGEITGLVNNETVTLNITGSQTQAGQSPNTFELYWDGTAKRTNYAISEQSSIGTLSVYYEITYDANGGEGAPDATKAYSADAALSETEPTREGYTFQGWAESADAETADYQAGDSVTLNDNLDLYAVWTEGDVEITYTAGEGGSVNPANETLKAVSGEAAGSTATPDSDHVFVNWTDADGKEVSKDAKFVPEKVNGLNVAANYTANFKLKEFDITYDLAGGTYNGSTDSIVETHEIGEEITIHAAPTKDGFVFVEWRGSSYQPGEKYTVKEDHTFTAIWEAEATDDEDTPDEGDTSGKTDKTNKSDKSDSSKGVKTGDAADLLGWMLLAIIAEVGMVYTARRRKED